MTTRSTLTALAATLSAIALTSTPARAAWTLLDNFDSYDNSGSTAVGTATGSVWTQNGANAANILDGAGSDQYLRIAGPGWSGAETNLAASYGSDFTVPNNTITTVFYQFRPGSTGTFDTMLGLSPTVGNIDATNAWQDYGVMPFYTNELRADLITGGNTASSVPTATKDVWYNIWLVIDTSDPHASGGLTDIYVSTGTNPGTLALENANMRNNLGMGAFAAMGFSQNGTGNMDVDNIYFDFSGANITNPVPEPSIALLGGLGVLGLLRRRRN